MEIFYPANELDVIRQMLAFFCWAWAAYFGWRFAMWQFQVWKEFLSFFCNLLHRLRR